MASAKYSAVKRAVGALFLIVSGRTIIDNLIRKPITWILTSLGEWCMGAKLNEGETPVLVMRWRDGVSYIHRAAVRGTNIRVMEGHVPQQMLDDFCDAYPDHKLKAVIASAVTGETPDDGDDYGPAISIDELMKSGPDR